LIARDSGVLQRGQEPHLRKDLRLRAQGCPLRLGIVGEASNLFLEPGGPLQVALRFRRGSRRAALDEEVREYLEDVDERWILRRALIIKVDRLPEALDGARRLAGLIFEVTQRVDGVRGPCGTWGPLLPDCLRPLPILP